MGDYAYTLLIPVALLYTEDEQFDALRVVKCKVKCSELVYSKHKDEVLRSKEWSLKYGYISQEEYNEAVAKLAMSVGSSVIPAAMSTLVVDKIVSQTVVEVSLREFSKDKTLRQQLISSVNNYNTTGIHINGVREITRVYKDRVVGKGILYPLISFKGIVTQRVLGFFDFTGALHTGTNDIPCQYPYTHELNILCNKSCVTNSDIDDIAYKTDMGDILAHAKAPTDTTATLLGSIALSERISVSCFVQQPQKVDTAAAAAHMLMGRSVQEQIFRVDNYYQPELLQPTLLVPDAVHSVVIQELHNTPDEKALRLLRIPTSVKSISLLGTYSPQISGLRSVQLHKYSVHVKKLTQFDLPKGISGDIIDANACFYLGCTRANYLGPALNLSAVMTDAREIQLDFGELPWDTVAVPCVRGKFILNAGINRPEFKVMTTPQRNTIASKTGVNTSATAGIVFDTTTGGAQKHVLLNFGALTPWYAMDISLATHVPNGYNNFDGTQNKVQLILGAEGKLRRYVAAYPMSLTTDCSMMENIVVQNMGVLYYVLRKLPLKKGEKLKASGATHITGNIGTLHILIEPHAGIDPVKDIYIDGAVQNIMVSFSASLDSGIKSRGTLEENLAHVRVHIRDKSQLTSVKQDAGIAVYGNPCKLSEDGIKYKARLTAASRSLFVGKYVLGTIVV